MHKGGGRSLCGGGRRPPLISLLAALWVSKFLAFRPFVLYFSLRFGARGVEAGRPSSICRARGVEAGRLEAIYRVVVLVFFTFSGRARFCTFRVFFLHL